MKKITLPMALLFSAILSACGGSSEDSTPVDNTSKATESKTTVTENIAGLSQYLWAFDADDAIRSTAVLNGEITYFATDSGKVFALNTNDGSEIWHQKLSGKISGNLIYADNKVMFLSRNGVFYALNSETGAIDWQVATPGESAFDGWDYHTNSPIIHKNTVYIASSSGVVLVLNIDDGSEVTSYTLNGKLRGTPVIIDETLFISSTNGIYSINLPDGSENWHASETMPSSPQIGSGVLAIGSRATHVAGIDIATGEKLWTVPHGTSWVTGQPLAHNGTFYIGSSDNARFQAIDAKSGGVNWSVNAGNNVFSQPAIYNGVIYMTSADAYQSPGTGYIKAIDLAGTELWSLKGSNFISSPVVNDSAIFLGSDDGYFYAIALTQE